MYLEAEVYGLVFWAFLAVEGVTVLILLGLFLRSRNRALLWFGGQALWLGAAFFFFFRLVFLILSVKLFHTFLLVLRFPYQTGAFLRSFPFVHLQDLA